jgi:hypothetical protein
MATAALTAAVATAAADAIPELRIMEVKDPSLPDRLVLTDELGSLTLAPATFLPATLFAVAGGILRFGGASLSTFVDGRVAANRNEFDDRADGWLETENARARRGLLP